MPHMLICNFQEESIQRCSISTESHIGNSGPDDSSDDDNNPKNVYHNAENEVEPVTDDDNERALSGKMSESSGCTGSDLYEYKVISPYTHASMPSLHETFISILLVIY